MKSAISVPVRPNKNKPKFSKSPSLRSRIVQNAEDQNSSNKPHVSGLPVSLRLESKLDQLAVHLEARHSTPIVHDTYEMGMINYVEQVGERCFSNTFGSIKADERCLSNALSSMNSTCGAPRISKPGMAKETKLFNRQKAFIWGDAYLLDMSVSNCKEDGFEATQDSKKPVKQNQTFPRAHMWKFNASAPAKPFVHVNRSEQASSSNGKLHIQMAKVRKAAVLKHRTGTKPCTESSSAQIALDAYQEAIMKMTGKRTFVTAPRKPEPAPASELTVDTGAQDRESEKANENHIPGRSFDVQLNRELSTAPPYDQRHGRRRRSSSLLRSPPRPQHDSFSSTNATRVRKDITSQITGGFNSFTYYNQKQGVLDANVWTSDLESTCSSSNASIQSNFNTKNIGLGHSRLDLPLMSQKGVNTVPLQLIFQEKNITSTKHGLTNEPADPEAMQSANDLDGTLTLQDNEPILPLTTRKFSNTLQSSSSHLDKLLTFRRRASSATSFDFQYFSSSHMYKIFNEMGHQRAKMGNRRPSARTLFMQVFEDEKIAPLPILDNAEFTVDGKMSLEIPNYGIGDKAGFALAKLLGCCHIPLLKLNVSGNCLNGPAIEALLEALLFSEHKHLQGLILSHNRMDNNAAKALAGMFRSAFRFPELHEVDIAHCSLCDAGTVEIIEAISCSLTVEKFSLQGNGIGSQKFDCKAGLAIAKLMQQSLSINQFDLSWNNLHGDQSLVIAKALHENTRITYLNLAFNHFGSIEVSSLLAKAIESQYLPLKKLDLSFNHLSGQSAALLLEALMTPRPFNALVLDGNPLKDIGLAAIVKALASGKHISVSVKGCDFLAPPSRQQPTLLEQLPLSPLQAAGVYQMDLSNSFHQLLTRHLVDMAASNGGKAVMQGIAYNGTGDKCKPETFEPPDWNSASVASQLQLPTTGTLNFIFQWTPANIFKKPDLSLKVFRKILQICSSAGQSGEQSILQLVDLLANGFILQPAHIQELFECVHSSFSKVQVASTLFPHVLETPCMEVLFSCLTDKEIYQLENQCGNNMFWFNPANPTGHYRLNMALSSDRLLAQKLLEMNFTEKMLRKASTPPKPDLSQHGTNDMIRNSTLDDKPFLYQDGFVLPSSGWLAFDFVSQIRKNDPQAITESALEEIIQKYVGTSLSEENVDTNKVNECFQLIVAENGKEQSQIKSAQVQKLFAMLGESMSAASLTELYEQVGLNCDDSIDLSDVIKLKQQCQINQKLEKRIRHLRRLSSTFFLSQEQFKTILSHFTQAAERVEIVCMLFPRLVSEASFHKVLHSLNEAEYREVQMRLGHLNLFNPFHPYGLYTLDLSVYDQKRVALIVANMGVPGKTLVDEKLDGNNLGVLDLKIRRHLFQEGIYQAKLLESSELVQDAQDLCSNAKNQKQATRGLSSCRRSVEIRAAQNENSGSIPFEISKTIANTKLGWIFPDKSTALSNEEQLCSGMTSRRTILQMLK